MTIAKREPLSLIVAIAKNGVIGRAGKLPWNYPEDRAHFERETLGHAVIMGRRTFEETGTALPGRTNIVVTRRSLELPDVLTVHTLDEAIALARRHDPEPFVIGGAALFTEAMPRITRALITEIPETPEGDVYFRFDARDFELVSERLGAMGERYLEHRRLERGDRPL